MRTLRTGLAWALLLCLVFVAVSCSRRAAPKPVEGSPKVAAALKALAVPTTTAGLSDRDGIVELAGMPDIFEVSFEVIGAADASSGKVVRYDTWTYYDLLTAFEFADGSLVASYPVDDVTTMTVVPNQIDPRTFDRALTWNALFERLGRPADVAKTVLPPEYEVNATAYATGQLLVVFDDEGLVYAETIPVAVGRP